MHATIYIEDIKQNRNKKNSLELEVEFTYLPTYALPFS